MLVSVPFPLFRRPQNLLLGRLKDWFFNNLSQNRLRTRGGRIAAQTHQRTNVLGHTFAYAYDKAGNLIQSADQRSGVLNYVYDKIGRIQEARQ